MDRRSPIRSIQIFRKLFNQHPGFCEISRVKKCRSLMEPSSSVSQGPKPKRSQQYPTPLTFGATGQHRQSFIVLHGRGSNAETFGPALLETRLPDGQSLREALPHVKFIFPTASYRRSTVLKRIPITQWFNNFSLKDPSQRQELQIEGLRESSAFIHTLLLKEVESVGASNVVLGGLSQGCAAMLITLLLWTGHPIRAAFGMSGWLPFQNMLTQSGCTEAAEDDLFETRSDSEQHDDNGDSDADSEIESKSLSKYELAVQNLFEELDLAPRDPMGALQVPIFIGHGADDEKVSVQLGEEAASTLEELGCKITWRAYEGLGHWYSGNELADVVAFIEDSGSGE